MRTGFHETEIDSYLLLAEEALRRCWLDCRANWACRATRDILFGPDILKEINWCTSPMMIDKNTPSEDEKHGLPTYQVLIKSNQSFLVGEWEVGSVYKTLDTSADYVPFLLEKIELADKLMYLYIPNDDTKFSLLWIEICCWNLFILNLF